MTLGLVFGLRLRQAEGLLESVLQLMGLALAVPDHTTLSRRARTWQSPNKRHDRQGRPGGPLHVVVDSTGLQVYGAGQWLAAFDLIEIAWDSQISSISTQLLPLRPAGMSKALSVDLRVRVLAAVARGLTHRQAGEQVRRERSQRQPLAQVGGARPGNAHPGPLGGDRARFTP